MAEDREEMADWEAQILREVDAEQAALRDSLAAALYAAGDDPSWLTTVDGSPNAASFDLADRVLDWAAALHALDAAAHEPCEEETYSWDHYRPEQIDPYWMRCSLLGAHEVHENSDTGLTWGSKAVRRG